MEEVILQQVEGRIREMAGRAPAPVAEAALHLVTAGGKRLRPRIVFHASQIGTPDEAKVVELAAAAELVHNASLLHDDVIDEAPVRRGLVTARAQWGNALSVLAGDHLIACALEILDECGVPGMLPAMLGAMRRLVQAEVVQLAHRGTLLPNLDQYYAVIRGKTAALFAWCGNAGAAAAQASEPHCRALTTYAEEMGVAFQLFDDLLDVAGSPEALGKSLFSDIAQGVATLPVILAAQREPKLAQEILSLAAQHSRQAAHEAEVAARVRSWVQDTGAAEETRSLARLHIDMAVTALAPLAEHPFYPSLVALANIMVDRSA